MTNNKTWVMRTIIFFILSITALTATDEIKTLLWALYATIFYLVCRVEDIAKYIGEK